MTSQTSSSNCRELAAIVLTGGKSSRMGTDKALLMLGQQTMLDHICNTLLTVVDRVVIVAAKGQAVGGSRDRVRVVFDQFPNEGPLGGFLTGLRSFHEKDTGRPSAVWLTACDTPLIPASVITDTHGRLRNSSADAVVVSHQGRCNPLIGVYQAGVLPTVQQVFENGERSMTRFLKQLDLLTVDSADVVDDPALMTNMNHPEDLTAVLELMKSKAEGDGDGEAL